MLYREAGQFKSTYAADASVFPLREDRIGLAVILLLAFVGPFVASDFMLQAVLIPFLVFSLAAIGLNILTGYTGLVSLGTGAFMGVGAYACYKLTTIFPSVNIIVWVIASGFFSAAVGALFGLPSLRIKGFYLAVATLAAQFFLSWAFFRIAWLYNYNTSGAIEVPTRTLAGIPITGATATSFTRYLVVLTIVAGMTWLASNLVHGRIGRSWMAVRDMDLAAELIGIRLLPTKLLAFAVSSFYCGVAGGVLGVFLYGGGAGGFFLVRRRRSRRVRREPELLHPVHGHRWGARQPDRLVPRRRADLHPADRNPRDCARNRAAAAGRDGREPAIHHRRRADYLFPDR